MPSFSLSIVKSPDCAALIGPNLSLVSAPFKKSDKSLDKFVPI